MATINSGIVLRILPMTTFTFGATTGLVGTTGTLTLTLAKHIDITAFTEVDLVVRAHSGTTINNGNFSVQIVPDGYDFEDPTQDFFGAANPAGATGGAVQFSASGAAYKISSINLSGSGGNGTGRLVAVQLVANQLGPAGSTLTVVVSIDLVCKGGDPSAIGMMPNAYRGYRVL